MICQTSFSQKEVYKSSLLGEPRKTSASAFYSTKKQIIDYIGRIRGKATTQEIKQFVLPQKGKIIIHDSSIIPKDGIAEEITSNLKYFDNFLIFENANVKYQIKIEYEGDEAAFKSFLIKEKSKILENVERSIQETGFTPSKILVEREGNDFNFFVFNSSETTKGYLKESYITDILLKSKFFGDVSEFQKLSDIPVTGVIDEQTVKKVKEYADFYDNTVIPYNKSNNLIYSYNEGKTETIDIVEDNGFYKKRYLNEADIQQSEESQKSKIKLVNQNQEADLWVSICSRNNTTEKASIFMGNQVIEADWKNIQNYDELYPYWDKYFEKYPNKNTIVLLRDDFQTSTFAVDKLDEKSDISSKTLINKYTENRTWINYIEFARNLKEKYPDKKVILSNKTDYRTIRKVTNPTFIKSSEEIGAYIASNSFGVEADQVAAMRETLTKGKISVFEVNEGMKELPDGADKANILLISGHKNQTFEAYIKELADKGLLNGKSIGLFSCYENGSANLNSYLISKGAKEVHFFPSKISVPATKAVLKEISKISVAITDINKNGVIFDELMIMGVENAIKNPEYSELVAELTPLQIQIKQIAKTKNVIIKDDRG